MIDIIALAFAVFLLLQLQRARALLSFVFGPLRLRRIGFPRLPDAFADLYAAAESELRALGFDEPLWYLLDSPDGGVITQPVVAWRQREHGDVVWLFAPASPAIPNRLVSVFSRRLADGRHCLSQAFDCYSELLGNERILAHTIDGADFAAQWQLHRDFCVRNGDADLSGTDDAALDEFAAELHERRLASLVERGMVYRDTQGLLRPTPAFAWRMYRAMWRQPRPPVNKEPVPPARLAWLAQVAQRQTLRPVPRRVQTGLFLFSVALFLAIGGWFWGLRFAAILFVVVAIHEFGHYLAMRLSGYRNVQMLALPLVGGVTIGHEARPDAARRAWMSLMGPLPGIVIGWGLLVASAGDGLDFDSLAFQASLVFLFVNYLNVLPVPPLDGAHVVQELLPVGSARLSAVFIAVASILGALIAYWFGFTLLVLIALLQLPLVRTRWQLGAVLHLLRGDPDMHDSQPAMLRQRRMFEVFDRVAGATAQAPARLALGAEAMRSIDVRPMRPLQRVFVGGTYAVLLAGPVLAGVVAIGFMPLSGLGMDTTPGYEKQRQRSRQLEAQAAKLGVAELLRDVDRSFVSPGDANPAATIPTPAQDTAIAAAQTRLGAALPEDLLAIYRISDGSAALGLRSLDRLRRVGEASDVDLSGFAYEGRIQLRVVGDPADAEVPHELSLTPQQMRSFVVLADGADTMSTLLYDIDDPPQHTGLLLYSLDYEGSGYVQTDLRAWLRSRWVESTQVAEATERMNAARERERAVTAGWSTQRLLDEIERPGFLQRRIAPQTAWSGPANDADLAGVAARLGAALPDDLAGIYRQHDGIPALALLPLAQWQAVSSLPGDVAAMLRQRIVASQLGIESPVLDQCVVFSGHYVDPQAMATKLPEGVSAQLRAGLRSANALWCPRAAADRRIVDIANGTFRPNYTEILRNRVVQQRASRAAME